GGVGEESSQRGSALKALGSSGLNMPQITQACAATSGTARVTSSTVSTWAMSRPATVAASVPAATGPRYARRVVGDDVLEPAVTAAGGEPRPDDGGFSGFHSFLTFLTGFEGQVAFHNFFPLLPGRVVEGYDGAYAGELARLGVVPYGLQARVLSALGAGQDVVIATATASGKSLVFQVPLASAVSRGGTGVVLYPTKALAHDQLGRLRALYGALRSPADPEPETAVATYDGDTAAERRAAVR